MAEGINCSQASGLLGKHTDNKSTYCVQALSTCWGRTEIQPLSMGQAGRVWWVSEGRPGGVSLCPPAWSRDTGRWNRMGQGTGPPSISWPHSQGQVRLPSPLAKLSPSPREGSEPGKDLLYTGGRS